MNETNPKKTVDFGRGSLVSTIFGIIESILFVVAGILAIAYSGNPDFQTTIITIVGAFLIVSGAFKCILNFLPLIRLAPEERAGLSFGLVVGGSFELAFGVSLIVLASQGMTAFNAIVTFLANFIGILLIVGGTSLVAFAIGFLVRKLYNAALPVVQILLGLVALGLGIVVLVYMGDANNFVRIVLIIVGILLALIGIALLVRTIVLAKERIAAKKAAKAATAETESAEESAREEGASNVVDEKHDAIDVEAKEKEPIDGPKAIDHDEKDQ